MLLTLFISGEKQQQLLLSMYKMRLIGQKEHGASNGLITLASHQGKKPNSIQNERILSAFVNLPLILSVSPNIFIFHSNKIFCLLSVWCFTANILSDLLHHSGRYLG